LWHEVHWAVAAYGMWLAGLSWPLKKLVPLWHCEQSPALGCEGSAMANVPPTVVGRVLKPVYFVPAAPFCFGEIAYSVADMPIQFMPVSWQLEQPPVTPAWICAVVGTGEANKVPGAVFVALAAIEMVGVLPAWQLSQVVLDGMCEPAPIGLVGGIPTILVMPAKLGVVVDGTWQLTQLVVMPAWLISEPLNLAPLGTGKEGTLEPAPTWHDSHAAVVGRWLVGKPTIEKFAAGIAKLAAAAPWHCAQLAVVLGA